MSKISPRVRKQFVEISLLCTAILPVFILGWLISRYGVNVPYYDQWGTPAIIFEKIHSGTLSFQDFVAQHNESRKLFPRLFFVGLAYLTNWNIRYELLSTLLVACAISISIYRLSQITLGLNRSTALALLIPVNMLIFSPSQWENWVWGIQVIVLIPVLCISLCLIVSYSSLSLLRKIFLCAALSTISTYSYANGMLCWIASLAALFFSDMHVEKELLKGKIRKILLPYGFICIFVIATYFYDYRKPASHPSFLEAVVHPSQAITYFMAFVGSPLSGANLTDAVASGLFLTASFFLALLYCLVFNRSSQLLYSSKAWIILGFYSLLSALITTLGRVGFGVEQALSSRYTTFSVYLGVAIIYLLVSIILELKRRGFPSAIDSVNGVNTKIFSASVLSCVITVIVTLHLTAFSHAVQAMQMSMRERLYLKACLTYIHFSDDVCKLKLFPDVSTLEKRADAVNKMGFLTPKLAESSVVRQAKTSKKVLEGENGWFDQFSQVGANQYAGSGWATLPNQKRSADAVLLTYKDVEAGGNRWRLFAIAPVQKQRDDVVKVHSQPAYAISGWETSFSTKALPKGKIRLRAWAYDSETGEAFRLKKTHLIQN